MGATRGLLRTLLALLREDGVTHVACAFDTVIESFRNRLFAGYKTGEGVPEELMAQFPLAERAAHALGLVVWPMVEFEADDALATGASRWGADEAVEQVVICSPDKDLAQCVADPRVAQLDRRQRRLFDEAAVREKFGVSPASIPDWLALVGDNADGFPGLPGWGAKSAATVLARYEHLDAIPDDASAWDVTVRGAPKLAATLVDGQREVMLFRDLATLRADVPVGTVDEWRWRGPTAALEELSERLGAADLLTRAKKAAEGREP